MSTSYWMKSQDGNYSNDKVDTFNPGKKYVGVRLQAGLLPLDRDWNELEDIRRYEEVMLRKWYIGNGTPDDGFKITPSGTSNDFNISPGRCLVEGFEAVNDFPIPYSGQKDLPALSVPPGQRSDTVYIDLWIREVSGLEDPALMNPQDLGRETCRRHRVEWQVRVDEDRGAESKGHSPEEEFHHYYDIARIDRDGSQVAISDLRRTGLSVYLLRDRLATLEGLLTALSDLGNSVSTLKDELTKGKVADGLHSHSKLVGSSGSPDPALSVDSSGDVQITGSLVIADNLNVGSFAGTGKAVGAIESIGPSSQFRFYRRSLKSSPQPPNEPAAGDRFSWYNPDGSASLWTDKKGDLLCVTGDGNVGIGTMVPHRRLTIKGDRTNCCISLQSSTNDNGRWEIQQDAFLDDHFGIVRYAGGVPDVSKSLTLTPDGKVGIGTADPKCSIHSEGSEIHSGGPNAGLSFANRNINAGAYMQDPDNGQRWVWYSGVDRPPFFPGRPIPPGTSRAFLWCNYKGPNGIFLPFMRTGHVLSVDVHGNVYIVGNISAGGDIDAKNFPTPTSDVRLKTNIIPLENVLNKLDEIRGVSFEWNEIYPYSHKRGRREIGLIAQEVERVFPELVITRGDEGYLGIDYGRLTGVLLEAIKELKSEMVVFKRKMRDSDEKIVALERALVR